MTSLPYPQIATCAVLLLGLWLAACSVDTGDIETDAEVPSPTEGAVPDSVDASSEFVLDVSMTSLPDSVANQGSGSAKADLACNQGAWKICQEGIPAGSLVESYKLMIDFLREEDYARALPHVQKIRAAYVYDSQIWAHEAYTLAKLGQTEEAMMVFYVAAEADPEEPLIFAFRSDIKVSLGDSHGAREDLSRAADLDPENLVILEGAAKLFRESGHFEEALRYINQAIEVSDRRCGSCLTTAGETLFMSDFGNTEAVREACALWSEAGELGYVRAYEHIRAFC